MKLEIDRSQLMEAVGARLSDEELVKLLRRLKIEVEELGSILKLELADTNRIELVSLRGIARELKRMLGKALGKYEIKSYLIDVFVDKKVKSIRPYIATSVIKGVEVDDSRIKELIQVQERLDATIGRNRKVTSIGLYDFGKLKPPIFYKIVPPNIKFVPLGFEREMSLAEILELHPKGKEYGWILASVKAYPLLTDSSGQVLSFPPIINSNDLGRVTEDTRDILIEVTGTSLKSVERVLKIMSMDLIDMGGICYGSVIHYPRSLRKSPIFQNKKISFNPQHFWMKSGVKLKISSLKKLLKFSGFNLSRSKKGYQVEVPFYREDVMDEVDIIEEILLHYGYENLAPQPLSLPTTGRVDPFWEFLNEVRNVLTGLGFHEILSFTLTNPQMLFDQMNLKRKRIIELLNPITSQFSCLRNSLLPSLLEFSSRNKRYFYPQKLFEIGEVFHVEDNEILEEVHLSAILLDREASFSSIKSVLDCIFRQFKMKYALKEAVSGTFIEGRCAEIYIDGKVMGIIGEINPQVLENWGLIMPASAFELDVGGFFGSVEGKGRSKSGSV